MARILLVAGMLTLLSMTLGCATIRKFGPVESHTLEARQLTQQAQSAMHRSDWDMAESKLVNALDRCPEDNRARACLAQVLWNRGAKQAAVEELSRSIELSGQRAPEALTQLGQMQLELGNPLAAQQRADEAISYNRELASAWTLRGRALRDQGRSQEALNAFFRSLSLRQDHLPTRLEIATIFRDLGKPDRALAILDGAQPTSPDYPCPHRGEVCYLRGRVMADLNRPQDAVAAFQQAREHGTDSPELLFYLAEAQLATGDLATARETLSNAAESGGPEYTVALSELRNRLDIQSSTNTPPWR